MIDWIELIPFAETRNYVQRVIENVAVYRAREGVARPYPVEPWRD
jgi:soluble lytic murein transglycosylase